MRYLLLCAVLVLACSPPAEYGAVTVSVCPPCPDVFSGFQTCAFYEVDSAWSREGMLVDHSQYAGVGTPIRVPGLMHHKFCFNQTHAVFGSANPTQYGLLISDNLIVTVESEILAQNFAGEYAYLLGTDGPVHTRHFLLNSRPVEHVFCPRHGCEDMLASYIHSAQEEIVFLSFAFTSQGVSEALIAAHVRGVDVQGVFEPWGARSQYGQFEPLKKAGVAVHLAPRGQGVMHHKAFVIDNTAIIGSYNPSRNANERNAETLVAFSEPAVVAAINEEFVRLTT